MVVKYNIARSIVTCFILVSKKSFGFMNNTLQLVGPTGRRFNLEIYESYFTRSLRRNTKLQEVIRSYIRSYMKLYEVIRNYTQLYEVIQSYTKLYTKLYYVTKLNIVKRSNAEKLLHLKLFEKRLLYKRINCFFLNLFSAFCVCETSQLNSLQELFNIPSSPRLSF